MRTQRAGSLAWAGLLAGTMASAPAAGAQVRSPFPERPAAGRVETRTDGAFWMGVGLGLGTAAFGAQLDASYWNERLYRLRVTVHGTAATTAGEPSDIAETALLVGTGRPIGRNWGHASAGIGHVSGSLSGGGDYSAVGLAGEVQLISQAMPHLAFGAIANLNAKASFASVTLGILIGRMPFERSTFPGGTRW